VIGCTNEPLDQNTPCVADSQ